MNAEADCKSVNGQIPVPESEQENTDYYNAFVTLSPKAQCGFIARVFHRKIVLLLKFIIVIRGCWDNPYNRGNDYPVICTFLFLRFPSSRLPQNPITHRILLKTQFWVSQIRKAKVTGLLSKELQ